MSVIDIVLSGIEAVHYLCVNDVAYLFAQLLCSGSGSITYCAAPVVMARSGASAWLAGLANGGWLALSCGM